MSSDTGACTCASCEAGLTCISSEGSERANTHRDIDTDVASLVDLLVATTRLHTPLARVILFGSHSRGAASARSDLDLLLLVAPPLTAAWNPKANVLLRSVLYRTLGTRADLVDIRVRTIDQYEEAYTVPVCPEHSAASEGTLLWSAAICRRPRPMRSLYEVRLDNADDWLRFASYANHAMNRADAEEPRGCSIDGDHLCRDAQKNQCALTLKHYEKCIRAAIVAWAISTYASIPDYTLPLARLAASVDHAFGSLLGPAIADRTVNGRARSASIAIAVATAAVRELHERVK